jgi:hypothetical protein
MPVPLPAPTTAAPSYAVRDAVPPADSLLDDVLGGWWPERDLAARPRLALAALGVGALAATVLPGRAPGLGTYLVLSAAAAVVATADRRVRTPLHLAGLVTALALGAATFLRDAGWVSALCVLAGLTVATATLAAGRSFTSVVLAGVALPLTALRGLPWLARSAAPGGPAGRSVRGVATAVVAVVAVAAFGALFASADAVFERWVDAIVPDVSVDQVVLRWRSASCPRHRPPRTTTGSRGTSAGRVLPTCWATRPRAASPSGTRAPRASAGRSPTGSCRP